jgi:hypothetical protein
MNKILLISLGLCIIIGKANAQMGDTTLNAKHNIEADLLLKKSKKQKNIAVRTLVGGAAITIAGLIFLSGEENKEGGAIMVIGGSGLMLISVPYFILSGNNKKKANLQLMHERVIFNSQSNLKTHLISLGVKINL